MVQMILSMAYTAEYASRPDSFPTASIQRYLKDLFLKRMRSAIILQDLNSAIDLRDKSFDDLSVIRIFR